MVSGKVFGIAARLLLGGMVWSAPLVAQTAQGSASAQKSIGFSNLVVRVDGGDQIGIAEADFRVHVLEDLRRRGLNAVGAENLVFGDRARAPELLLGGTVTELACQPGKARSQVSCRMGVEWQVLDVARDLVIYKVVTRGLVSDVAKDPAVRVGRQLLMSTLSSLTARPRFVALLQPTPAQPVASGYAPAVIRACTTAERAMPAASEQVLNATTLVETSDGFGSGFIVSQDGFVITAAHVVNGSSATVRLRDGRQYPASVVRIDRKVDVALLRLSLPAGADLDCLSLQATPAALGSDVYAIGAPARRELSFSLARGVVSGVRLLDGVQYLQTDAAVNSGNSGGPLINAAGQAVAVVSMKLTGRTIEGIAFGIPLGLGLDALKLQAKESFTSPELMTAASALPEAARTAFVDQPDAPVAFAPRLSSRERAQLEEKKKLKSSTLLAAIGWTALGTGALVLATSAVSESRELATLGWGLGGVGGASLVISLALP